MVGKRKDIQWHRGFSIAAVLAFHLLPKTFPYGYLGVDTFFVISGYLMTCIISNQSDETTSSFLSMLYKFYSQRIRRIFPSYFIVLALTFIVGKWLLLSFHFVFLSNEMLWASFFATNLKKLLFEKESYFSLISEYRFLLHTWSLGVEIQFYFIAPFLLTVIASSKHPCVLTFMVMCVSAGSQLYFYKSPISFNFFGCRLWQFLSGTMVYYAAASSSTSSRGYTLLTTSIEAPTDEQQSSKNLLPTSSEQQQQSSSSKIYPIAYSIVLLFLGILCFGPKYSMISEIFETIFRRFLAILLSALLIYFGTTFQSNSLPILNQIFTYFGDISYNVYLYHWPILLFAKYYGFDASSKFSTLMGLLLLIFAVSILHYHLVETQLSKLSPAANYWIIAFLFGTILYFSIINYHLPPTSSSSKLIINDTVLLPPLNDSEAIRVNLEMTTICRQIPFKCEKDALLKESFNFSREDNNIEGRCVLNLSKNGTKSAAVLGNSYAMRHINAIVAALNTSKYSNTFSKIYLVSWKGCTSFESTFFETPQHFHCQKIKGYLLPFLQKLRPSLTIMINRLDFLPSFYGNTPFNPSSKKFIDFKNDFLTIANLSSQTIVFEPHHNVGDTMKAAALTLAKTISDKLPLIDLERNATHVHQELNLSWTKMKAAMLPCKNCHVFEVLKYFCNETICETFDRKNRLSYFCDGYHFTTAATNKLIKPLKTLINSLIF